LLVAVLLALAAAVVGAVRVPVPPVGLPVVALGSMLVWRVEIAAILFVAAYAGIVTVRLAFHGHTLTRVGSGGIEIPPVGEAADETRAAQVMADGIARSVSELRAAASGLGQRSDAGEDPSQLVLIPNEEET